MNSLNLPVYRRKLAQKSALKTVCYAASKSGANVSPIAGTPRFGPAGYRQNRTPSPSWRPVLTPDRSPFFRKGGGYSPDQEATWNRTNRGERTCDPSNLHLRLLRHLPCWQAAWAMTSNARLWALLSAVSARLRSAAAWQPVRLWAQRAVRWPTISNARCANTQITTTHMTGKAAKASLCAAFLHALRPLGHSERTS